MAGGWREHTFSICTFCPVIHIRCFCRLHVIRYWKGVQLNLIREDGDTKFTDESISCNGPIVKSFSLLCSQLPSYFKYHNKLSWAIISDVSVIIFYPAGLCQPSFSPVYQVLHHTEKVLIGIQYSVNNPPIFMMHSFSSICMLNWHTLVKQTTFWLNSSHFVEPWLFWI